MRAGLDQMVQARCLYSESVDYPGSKNWVPETAG